MASKRQVRQHSTGTVAQVRIVVGKMEMMFESKCDEYIYMIYICYLY